MLAGCSSIVVLLAVHVLGGPGRIDRGSTWLRVRRGRDPPDSAVNTAAGYAWTGIIDVATFSTAPKSCSPSGGSDLAQ